MTMKILGEIQLIFKSHEDDSRPEVKPSAEEAMKHERKS